eukprot:scaffold325519_cov54-Tisochrysis_lutea.AAC.2
MHEPIEEGTSWCCWTAGLLVPAQHSGEHFSERGAVLKACLFVCVAVSAKDGHVALVNGYHLQLLLRRYPRPRIDAEDRDIFKATHGSDGSRTGVA